MQKASLYPYGLLTLLPLLIMSSGIFLSCKKDTVGNIESTGRASLSVAEIKISEKDRASRKQASVTTEPYSTVLFDSCRNENILLTGQATYKLIESFDKGYYINYEIDLDKIKGVGERTGTVYHGGGKIIGIVKQNENATKVKGKVTYKVKYVGNNGNQIFFTQNARFISVNNVTKVDFNNIFDSCR